MHGKLKKTNIIIAAVNAVLLIIFAVLFGIISSLGRNYSADNAKKLWDNDAYSYSQLSLFLPPDEGLDIMSLYALRQSIEEKLEENSVKADENSPTGRFWIDCASGEYTAQVTGNTGSCEASVTGTAGDYFIFHPESLLNGSYYSSDDINFDRVIIDKQCSWQIFGAIDTAGLPVTIGGKVFYIAAVVDTPENERDIAAYGNMPRIYMPYEALQIINPGARMTSYEACLPDAVKGFAENIISEVNPSPGKGIIIDQSDRFGLITLFKGFSKIPENAMITNNLSYPWYENRTRGAEIIAQILAGPAVYILIIPAVSLVYAIYMLCRLAGKGARAVGRKAENAYQKRISEAYYKKHPRS